MTQTIDIERAFDESMTFLCNRWSSIIDTDRYENMQRSDFAFMLMDMAEKKGKESIIGLCGFYLFCFEHYNDDEQRFRAIRSTFAHDLNDRNEPVALPRSSGYNEYCYKFFNFTTTQTI